MVTVANLRESADLDAILPAWRRLADHSLAPAGLNAPELVMPLLRGMPGAELAVVKQGNDLLFALPIKKRRFMPALFTNWMTDLTIIGEPHLDREFPEAGLTSFINHLKSPILLHSLKVNGSFWNQLARQDAQVSILKSWERAALNLTGTYETWAESNFGAKRRKEYRRLRARLAEQGRFAAERMMPGDDTFPWVADFLRLEAASWKGRRGTAIDTDAAASAILHEASAGLAASGKLRFWKLSLDGRAIAMLYAVVEGGQAWLGKIAYDEAFAKFSPGVLLILDATAATLADPAIAFADSCAIPGHPMIDHIWRDRLALCSVLIPAPGQPLWKRRALVATERCHDGVRDLARNLLNRLRKRLHP